MRALTARPFDVLAYLVLALTLLVIFATFRGYGIAWDEQGETKYGSLLLKHYSSWFRDQSAYEFVNFRFYGGGFELPAALLTLISPFDEYETRHLLSALLGLTALALTWRLTRALGGTRAGVLALVLLLLNPNWYGNIFINARDVPFSAGMMACLILSLRALDELPRIRLRTMVLFGMCLGATVSVRVGGVMAAVFLVVPLGLWLVSRGVAGASRAELKQGTLNIAAALCQAFIAAYATMAVLWPWAVQSPLNPLHAFTMFSKFPFEGSVLFDGDVIPARALPATYLPVLLGVKQPEALLVGVAFAVLFGLAALRRGPRALLERGNLRFVTVVVAALLPIVYFIVARPTVYNGMRHFLFVLPPLTVLAALAFDRAARTFRALRVPVGVGLTLASVVQIQTLIELHPDQYVYFNELVGGPAGAQGRFELDYWGTSLAEATQEFVETLERRHELPREGRAPLKVYVCGNVWSAAEFFPPGLVAAPRLEEADYEIAITEFFCKRSPNGKRLLDVKRDDALLSYVDDVRPPPTAANAARGVAQQRLQQQEARPARLHTAPPAHDL